MRTLDTGGVSSIGYATTELGGSGLLGWFRSLFSWNGDESEDEQLSDAEIVRQLVRRAMQSELTLPCDVSSAERTLILLSGPTDSLSRKGFETARYWVEQEADTVEVLAGDEPDDRYQTLSALVLLSNVTTVPVIDELQSAAVDALPVESAESEPAEAEFSYD
jgi:cell division GTPase FtsZ